MDLIFPGTKQEMKRGRAIIGEAITGVRSRLRLEQFDVTQLQQCVGILMAFERRMKAEPQIEEDGMLHLLAMAKQDFRGAGPKDKTPSEVMLQKSVEQVKANGGGDSGPVLKGSFLSARKRKGGAHDNPNPQLSAAGSFHPMPAVQLQAGETLPRWTRLHCFHSPRTLSRPALLDQERLQQSQ